jgi:hypothetical protein
MRILRRSWLALVFAILLPVAAHSFGGGVAKTTPAGEIQVTATQIGVGLSDTGSANAANLLLSSQEFTAPDWVGEHLNAADNSTTAPDSTITAASLTEADTSTAVHRYYQTFYQSAAAIQYTFSVHLKQALRTRAVVVVEDLVSGAGAFAVFNLVDGSVGVAASTYGVGWSVLAVNPCTSAGNGFYRCHITITTASSTTKVYAGVSPDSGSGTGSISNTYAGNTGSAALYTWGAQIETGSSTGVYGHVTNRGSNASALTDNDLTSVWGTLLPNAWVGYDSGNVGTQWTRYRFSPRPGSTKDDSTPLGLDYEHATQGSVVESSSASDFSSGTTTLDTIPSTIYYPRTTLSERSLSGTARYIRLRPLSNSFGSLAELQFFAKTGTTTNGRPVAPTISPWGGHFPSGSTSITISSLTTSALIYYTTDGSTPSNTNGTLYTGTFTLSLGASTTFKAVAYQAGLSSELSPVSSAVFANYGFKPKDDIADERGNLTQAVGGGVTYNAANSTYYWVGDIANKYPTPWESGPSNRILRSDEGVFMYKSTDLYSWTFVGNILAQPSNGGVEWAAAERPHLLHNAANNNWVIWTHCADHPFNTNVACVAATSGSDPETGWAWVNTNYDPAGVGFKDNSLFLDSDGISAYVVYTIGNQNGIRIDPLASDYKSITAGGIALTASNREAPVIVKNGSGGNYFLITSQSNFYNSAGITMDERYITTSSATPLSGWGALPGSSAFASDPAANSNYNAQSSFAIQPQGKTTDYLIGMDWWDHTTNFNASRQVWLPLTFPSSSTLRIGVPTSWDLGTLN